MTRFATRVVNLDSGHVVSDEPGGLASIAGQARTAVKDITKGAKNIVESIKDAAKDIIG